MAQENFAELLEESLAKTSGFVGYVAKGKIISIENDFAIIDVGLKSEGRVALKEFATAPGQPAELKVGDTVNVSAFTEGQLVDVIGVSKGKGFQGVVRRFRVAGGPASHGSMFHRRIGSIGMRQTPGRSWKNQSMPGHMGQERRTVQNLRLVKIIAEKNLLLVKGAIPGANGDDVIVRSAIKARTRPRPAAKSAAAARSRGSRRARAAPAPARRARPSGRAAASPSARSRATTRRRSTRR